ncbi:MAG: GbsR/MarR family transcriptional regulator [Pseudomonadota bacterium]
MGNRWGINRTVGQIYALLYVNEEALNAEQITQALAVSRSNVSMGLKELQAWRLVRLHHRPGDRRDYFSTPEDVWEILQTLVVERRRREIDPTLTMLRGALLEEVSDESDRYAKQRMQEMHDLIESLTQWLDEVQTLDRQTVLQLMKLGGGVKRLLMLGRSVRRADPDIDNELEGL